MCNYIYAPFYHLPISLSFSDHPSIQAWSFDFMVSCKKKQTFHRGIRRPDGVKRLCPNRTNLVDVARVSEHWHGRSQRWTYLKPGGHMRVWGPKILNWHSWKKYGRGALSDILHPCHRFLQMGFSLQTFWPLESGGGVWSHPTPPKSQSPGVFLFFGRVSSCFDWLCMCANNENELILHINGVVRRTHKSPLFDGEGSRLISWLSSLQIRGVTSGSLTQSVQHQEGGCIIFSFALFCSIFQNPLALLWRRNIRIWG